MQKEETMFKILRKLYRRTEEDVGSLLDKMKAPQLKDFVVRQSIDGEVLCVMIFSDKFIPFDKFAAQWDDSTRNLFFSVCISLFFSS